MALSVYYRNQNVLVTGGAGFIGSHMVEKLVDWGANVTILDDFSSGSINNLAAIADKITIIQGSVTDYDTCLRAAAYQHYIFHLAALVSVPESMAYPLRCHTINVTGTINMLDAAYVNNVSSFLLATSSAIYGDLDEPARESMLGNPSSPYGFSKLIGELYCTQYAKNYGLKTVMTRYFNVYGNRQSPQGTYAAVVAKFRDQMASNTPITIYGDGTQQRDFIPVDKVVQANLTLAALPEHLVKGEVFNIATGRSISIVDLFYMLRKDFPTYTLEPNFMPARPGDIHRSQADCSKYQVICTVADEITNQITLSEEAQELDII